MRRLLGALLLAAAVAGPASAGADWYRIGYPHISCYAGTRSWGYPLINDDQSAFMGLIRNLAKYQMITMTPTPCMDLRAGIMDTLHALNPNLIVLAYDGYTPKFSNATPGTMYKADWDAMHQDYNELLYDTDGNLFGGVTPWANQARLEVMRAQDSVWVGYIVTPRKADGLFLDTATGMIQGGGNPAGGPAADHVRAGYPTAAAMDTARLISFLASRNRLKGAGAPIICANGTMHDSTSSRSTWPDGLTNEGWYGGLQVSPFNRALGEFQRNGKYAWINSYSSFLGTDPAGQQYDAAHNKAMRFGLACACMGDGFASYTDRRDINLTGPTYMDWWYDEYSVNVQANAAVADTTGGHTGWLGMPLEAAHVDPITNVWVRTFEHGLVIMCKTGTAPTVDLRSVAYPNGRRYCRILGVRNAAVNDGKYVSSVTLNDISTLGDAIFLAAPTGQP